MNFRISLINDIVRGMAFLHASEIRYHGNLKSSNCVVDSRFPQIAHTLKLESTIYFPCRRFVLKLTDFGLHSLRRPECEAYSHQYYRSKLWTAPELLRAEQNLFSAGPPKKVSVSRMESSLTRNQKLQKSSPPVLGSAKADLYSFGIIVHEIIVRLGTWGSDVDFRAPEEILSDVINSGSRPQVDDTVIEPTLVSIMRRSWAEQPHERIDFATVKQEMRRVNRDTRNILDNLLSRMERCATLFRVQWRSVEISSKIAFQVCRQPGDSGEGENPRLPGGEEEVRGLVVRAPPQVGGLKVDPGPACDGRDLPVGDDILQRHRW